jgi:endoglycosylceramidase
LTAALALLALLGAVASSAAKKHSNKSKQQRLERKAAPHGPLGHAGRWITDTRGRVVVLHGLNMVYKRPPYYPAAAGFGADDAQFLHRNGFNTIRLGVIHKGVEPSPGVYDDSYIAQIAATEQILAKQGIFSLVDFHQDLLNERFGGEGLADWAVLDDGLAAGQSGFPGTYQTSPGLNRAFDNFWANAAGPGGVGIQDLYGAAWRKVAAAFAAAPNVLGYDIFNEPWPGSNYVSCIGTAGCPGFDANQLTDFNRRTIGYIRQADGTHLVFYEPLSPFNFGSQTYIGSSGDPRTGFSFHDYCLSSSAGHASSDGCKQSEPLAFQNAEAESQRNGDALILSEFGATTDLEALTRIEGLADANRVSWQEWHYCACDDPTTSGPGSEQALVIDPAQPPSGANVEQDKLRALVRPYPQAVAGTPRNWSFDPTDRRFVLVFDKAAATGSGSLGRGLTDLFIPKLIYPHGYRIKVRGAAVLSRPNAQQLILRTKAKAKAVSVSVVPG